MNIDNFIEYRKKCKLCQGELILTATKCYQYNNITEVNKPTPEKDFYSLKFERKYFHFGKKWKYNLSFNIDKQNKIVVSFLSTNGSEMNSIQMKQIKDFLEWIGFAPFSYIFKNICSHCNNYGYSSNRFYIDKKFKGNSIYVAYEHFIIDNNQIHINLDTKVVHLLKNPMPTLKKYFTSFFERLMDQHGWGAEILPIELSDFENIENIKNKLNTYLLFS